MLNQVLTPYEALAGFGDPVVILIAAIFIVGEALVNTGVVHRLGETVMKLGGGNETRLIVLIMTLAGGIGAFMNSSAIVAMFIPLVLTVARKTGLNSKRMLMPLSVATLIRLAITTSCIILLRLASDAVLVIDDTAVPKKGTHSPNSTSRPPWSALQKPTVGGRPPHHKRAASNVGYR